MNMVLVNYVSYYATQVRGFLKGLGQDTVEELTGGLEADLIEAMNESDSDKKTEDYTLDDLIARFGSPKAYAQELCESAGVSWPEQSDQPAATPTGNRTRRSPFGRLKASLKNSVASVTQVVSNTASKPNVNEILQDVKPVWWFLRAWLVYGAVVTVSDGQGQTPIPREFAYVLLFVVIFAASVWLGKIAARTNFTPRAKKIVAVTNVALLLFLPTVLTSDRRDDFYNDGYEQGWAEGHDQAERDSQDYAQYQAGIPQPNINAISLSGASNLYAYDSNGEFIPDVRIVDQNGNAISAAIFPVKVNRATQEVLLMNMREDEFGRAVDNVFPASFTAVDLDKDTCSQADSKFWSDVLNGFVSEEWDNKDFQDLAPEPGQYIGETGRLQSGEQYADFKYGANEREFYIGGKNTLSSNSDCMLGFKRSVLHGSEQPQIMTLPSLAPMPEPAAGAAANDSGADENPAEDKAAEESASGGKASGEKTPADKPAADKPETGKGEATTTTTEDED